MARKNHNKIKHKTERKPFKELNGQNVTREKEKPPLSNTMSSVHKADTYTSSNTMSYVHKAGTYSNSSTDCTRPPPGFGYYYDEVFSFPDFEELKIAVMEDSELRQFLVNILNKRRRIKHQQFINSLN